jgi:hypothetical protein
MKRFINTIAIALTLAVAAPAFADTHPGPGGSEVYTPKGWAVDAAEENGQAILIAVDPKQKAALLYVLVEAKNVAGAVKVVDTIVGKLVTEVAVTKGKAAKVGGVKALALSGTGKTVDGGEPATLKLLALQADEGHVLFAVAMVHTAVKKEYAAEFKLALAGIRLGK